MRPLPAPNRGSEGVICSVRMFCAEGCTGRQCARTRRTPVGVQPWGSFECCEQQLLIPDTPFQRLAAQSWPGRPTSFDLARLCGQGCVAGAGPQSC